jgi:hypothetical protein
MRRLSSRGLAVALVGSMLALVIPAGSISAAAPSRDSQARQLMTQLAKAPSLDAAMAKLTPTDRDLAIQAMTPVTHKTTVTLAKDPTAGSRNSSLDAMSPSVVGAGCYNYGWINNSWYNSLGWVTFTYSNKFYWCSNGVTLSNVSRWETGSVNVVCWSYAGVNTHYQNGGNGQGWYESYSQGHFKCTTIWVDVQNAYPAIDTTIYAYGNPTYQLL